MSSVYATKRTKLSPREETNTELESQVTGIETINMTPDLIHTYLIQEDPILFLVVNKEFGTHARTKLWESLNEDPSWFPGRRVLTGRITRLYSPLYKAVAGNRPDYVKQFISHPVLHSRDPLWFIQKLSDRDYFGANRYTKDIIVALLSAPQVQGPEFVFPFDDWRPTLEEIPILLNAINTAIPGYFLNELATHLACVLLLLNNPGHEDSILRTLVDFLVSTGITVNFDRSYFSRATLWGTVTAICDNTTRLRLKVDLALLKNRLYIPKEVEYLALLTTLIDCEYKELLDEYSDTIIEHFVRISHEYTTIELDTIMVYLRYIIKSIKRKKLDNTEFLTVIMKMCVSHPLYVENSVYEHKVK